MKRRVLSKTTPFHPFKKKKKKRKRAERCRFERHCSSFFFPPEHAAGKKGKMVLFFEIFAGPSLSPGAHRPNTMADHPPRTCQKAGEGGRALAVAPNGRPAGCSPCSTAKSHSLGSINNNQHDSRREGGEQTGEEGENEKQRRERGTEKTERERKGRGRREPKEGKTGGKKTKEGEEKGRKQRRRKEEESLFPPLETAAPLLGVAAREQRHRYQPPPQNRQKRSQPPLPPPRQVTFLPLLPRVYFLVSFPACRTSSVLHAGVGGK
jgi:hypothetical protein